MLKIPFVKMRLVGLKNLSDSIRVNLDENFRNILFKEAIKKSMKVTVLAKQLACHTDTILNLRKGKSFIKVGQIKKLSQITNISLEEIENHIDELRSRDRDRRIDIKFPIFATAELASVIGHCMGDGSLSNKQFSYFNQRRELVNEVIENVKIAFSTNVEPCVFKKSGGWEIEFPTNIARLIATCGGPVGQKVFSQFRVPLWIMSGANQIKASFLRALFDDEGWIKIKINPKTKTVRRMIGINISKNSKFADSHKKFFEDIKKLLSDLEVRSSRIVKMGETKNGDSFGIIISNFKNLSKFYTNISFTSVVKNQKLLTNLTNSKRFNFVAETITRNES